MIPFLVSRMSGPSRISLVWSWPPWLCDHDGNGEGLPSRQDPGRPTIPVALNCQSVLAPRHRVSAAPDGHNQEVPRVCSLLKLLNFSQQDHGRVQSKDEVYKAEVHLWRQQGCGWEQLFFPIPLCLESLKFQLLKLSHLRPVSDLQATIWRDVIPDMYRVKELEVITMIWH